MKILITTDLYAIKTNGVVTSLKNLREELIGKGHEVRVLTFSENIKSHKEEDVYFIKSLPIGFIYPNVRMPISYHNQYVKEIIEWKPDIIHSQCEFFSYHFAQHIAKKTGASLIHTYHTMYEDYVTYVIPFKRIGKYIVKKFSCRRLKNADTVIAPTTKVEHVLREYGLKNHIEVVPSGVALSQHERRISPEERLAKRRELGIPDDHQVALNLGRLGTEKNLDELIEYFASLLKAHEKLTFLIVGDGPAKKDLEELAEKLGIASRIIFTGMIPPTEVQEYYQLADVFMSASTSETQGLTYIEAAANGLPLLCRKDDCLTDIIIEGENGYQYTNEEEFEKDFDRIMDDSAWRIQAGEKSARIAQVFDKSHFGDTMAMIYELSLEDKEEER